MRALLLFVFVATMTGCLWDDSPAQVPPKECAATTNPRECNKSFGR